MATKSGRRRGRRLSKRKIRRTRKQMKGGYEQKAMQIFAKLLNGKTIVLDVFLSDTIHEVKQKIQAKTGLQANQITLVFAGIQLENSQTLSHYHIQAAETIHESF